MRRGWLVGLVVILLSSSTTAVIGTLSLPYPIERQDAGEVVLTIDGHWDSNLWVEIREYGFEPLRQLSFDSVVAWGELGSELPGGVSAQPSQSATWKPGIDGGGPAGGDVLVVVFEPRLPNGAVQDLYRVFSELGLAPAAIPLLPPSSPLPISIELVWPWYAGDELLDDILSLPGIMWIEPSLEGGGRNSVGSGVMQNGGEGGNPAWLLGLDGEGIVLGIADTGVDRDHACFRNASIAGGVGSEGVNGTNLSATPGDFHRKILLLNESLDDWDNVGDISFKHGTHTAGTLACRSVYEEMAGQDGDWLNASPGRMSAMSHSARLVIQDIVNDTIWFEPAMDGLLWENMVNGGVIHSDSWGDPTTAYTERSHNLDAWARENPWSLVFVAPGNNGGQLMEPANARSVVAVGATKSDGGVEMYSSSSHGPTDDGTRGIFLVAPGVGVVSARADGIHDSANDESRVSSGTSMSTPAAASAGGVIQQMVEDGWLSRPGIAQSPVPVVSLRPDWAIIDENLSWNGSVVLAQGFTPSNNLLRALLALSANPLAGGVLNGTTMGQGPDNLQGWGRPVLSRLVDFSSVEQGLMQGGNVTPSADIWMWDSFAMENNTWQQSLQMRMDSSAVYGGPLARLSSQAWSGQGAAGPFLASGEEVVWRVERSSLDSDLDLRLAWNARPSPAPVDDLQLIATLPDGRFAIGDEFNSEGNSTVYVDFSFVDEIESNGETVVGIRLNETVLGDSEWIDIRVRARGVVVGNVSGSVGNDGDRVGFSVVAKGVLTNRVDSDGDAVPDMDDSCPDSESSEVDQNGCAANQRDSDGDGYSDDVDLCEGFDDDIDMDNDAIPDACDPSTDGDGDGIYNDVDLCMNTPYSDPVNSSGCYPNTPVEVSFLSPSTGESWSGLLPIDVLIEDVDANRTTLEIIVEYGGKEFRACVQNVKAIIEVIVCDVDISLTRSFFDPETDDLGVDVRVIVHYVEADLEYGEISSGTVVVEDVRIEYSSNNVGGGTGVDGLDVSRVWWPFFTFMVILLAAACVHLFRLMKGGLEPENGGAKSPFIEEE